MPDSTNAGEKKEFLDSEQGSAFGETEKASEEWSLDRENDSLPMQRPVRRD